MEISAYRRAWERRWRDEDARDRALAEHAQGLLPALVRVLVDDFGAHGVVLVGSLARGSFRAGSDVDLVASGLPGDRLFVAGAALDRAAGELHVDLVPWESCTAAMREVVAREGVVLHGEL